MKLFDSWRECALARASVLTVASLIPHVMSAQELQTVQNVQNIVSIDASGSVRFAWDANSEADLAGYRLYMGTQSRVYSSAIPTGLTSTYQLTGLAAGATYYFALTAVNTAGLESDSTPELVYVVPPETTNTPPTLEPIANMSISEDSAAITVPLRGISAGTANESQTLAIAANSSNPNVLPHPVVTYVSPNVTGSLTLQPRPDFFGVAVITVTVDDGQLTNNLTSRSFTVTVQNINDPPLISTIAPQAVTEDAQTAPIPFTITDVETPAANLVVTAASSNPSLIGQILFGGTGANRTLTLQPVANEFGTATITVEVRDAASAAASSSFNLTVSPVNDAPYFDPVADIVLAPAATNHQVLLLGLHSGAPNEADPLIVTASSSRTDLIPAPEVVYSSPGTSALLILRPIANAAGISTITAVLSDGQAQPGTFVRTFNVTVEQPGNTPPVISAIPDQAIPKNRPSDPIAFTITDAETSEANLQVSATSSNPLVLPDSGITLAGSDANRTVILDPTNGRIGETTITISVTDGLATTSLSFAVTIGLPEPVASQSP